MPRDSVGLQRAVHADSTALLATIALLGTVILVGTVILLGTAVLFAARSLHECLEPFAIVAWWPAAATLGLATLGIGGNVAGVLHTRRPQAQAAEQPLKLSPLLHVGAFGLPLHRLPTLKKRTGLIATPSEFIEDISPPRIHGFAEVFEGKVGRVAGVFQLLCPPFRFSGRRRPLCSRSARRWSCSFRPSATTHGARLARSLRRRPRSLLAARLAASLTLLLGVTLWLHATLACWTSCRLLTFFRATFLGTRASCVALSRLTLSLLTLSRLTLSLLTLSRLTLSRLTLSLLTLSLLTLSRLTLSLLALSLLTLSRLALSRLALSRLALSRLTLSRLTLSRLTLVSLAFTWISFSVLFAVSSCLRLIIRRRALTRIALTRLPCWVLTSGLPLVRRVLTSLAAAPSLVRTIAV